MVATGDTTKGETMIDAQGEAMERESVPRATAGDLSEPGFYFVDFGPGLPVSICEVFLLNVSLHPGTSPRATSVTPTLTVRAIGVPGFWTPADYVGTYRPRRVKLINPSVDVFAPEPEQPPRPVEPTEPAGTVAVPVPANVPGVPPAGKLQAFRDAHGPENAADVRRTGDPTDAQGDEFDQA